MNYLAYDKQYYHMDKISKNQVKYEKQKSKSIIKDQNIQNPSKTKPVTYTTIQIQPYAYPPTKPTHQTSHSIHKNITKTDPSQIYNFEQFLISKPHSLTDFNCRSTVSQSQFLQQDQLLRLESRQSYKERKMNNGEKGGEDLFMKKNYQKIKIIKDNYVAQVYNVKINKQQCIKSQKSKEFEIKKILEKFNSPKSVQQYKSLHCPNIQQTDPYNNPTPFLLSPQLTLYDSPQSSHIPPNPKFQQQSPQIFVKTPSIISLSPKNNNQLTCLLSQGRRSFIIQNQQVSNDYFMKYRKSFMKNSLISNNNGKNSGMKESLFEKINQEENQNDYSRYYYDHIQEYSSKSINKSKQLTKINNNIDKNKQQPYKKYSSSSLNNRNISQPQPQYNNNSNITDINPRNNSFSTAKIRRIHNITSNTLQINSTKQQSNQYNKNNQNSIQYQNQQNNNVYLLNLLNCCHLRPSLSCQIGAREEQTKEKIRKSLKLNVFDRINRKNTDEENNNQRDNRFVKLNYHHLCTNSNKNTINISKKHKNHQQKSLILQDTNQHTQSSFRQSIKKSKSKGIKVYSHSKEKEKYQIENKKQIQIKIKSFRQLKNMKHNKLKIQ